MKEEKAVKLFRGLADVGDDLIEEAGAVQERRRMPARWRWAAIAACLCLALLGTAAAVNFYGPGIVDGEDGFTYFQGGIAYYPYDDLSDEIKALESEVHFKSFDSWQAAEDFIGVDLMNNPVLDASPATQYYAVFRDEHSSVKGRFVATMSKRLEQVRLCGCYEIGEVNIDMYSLLFTDRCPEDWDERFWGRSFPEGTELSRELYTSPNGLQTQIMEVEEHAHDCLDCLAIFSLNGVPFVVNAHSHNSMEEARAALIQVLDGFEV